MYKDIQEHLKEMLEIGTIWPSHRLWASPVILVCKKDGNVKEQVLDGVQYMKVAMNLQYPKYHCITPMFLLADNSDSSSVVEQS